MGSFGRIRARGPVGTRLRGGDVEDGSGGATAGD